MTECSAQLPYVLVLAGHDPSGGAGLVADSEAIRAGGGWALTVPTALTVQNSCNVQAVIPQSGESMLAMARTLCEDFRPGALKIGLLASEAALAATVVLIKELRKRWPGLPVVWDPVLKAGGGRELSTESLLCEARERLLPQVDVLTPNRAELSRLAACPPGECEDSLAEHLLATGTGAVLVTGTDPLEREVASPPVSSVIHRLYRRGHATLSMDCPRLPGSFHGSGCTLASHLAVRLACGMPLPSAWQASQHATWQSLVDGQQRGLKGALPEAQYLPWR
ncbi:hydroxymethylpyrimidine/phosphomethylpyrimidine kinase [bacterium Scap17]|nr:hydroxymethylpyrimidine/phosphomethylpyrimidine kinase [bacterium Scap17]